MSREYKCNSCIKIADSYCLCNGIFLCEKCLQSHQELNTHHEIISIPEYTTFLESIYKESSYQDNDPIEFADNSVLTSLVNREKQHLATCIQEIKDKINKFSEEINHNITKILNEIDSLEETCNSILETLEEKAESYSIKDPLMKAYIFDINLETNLDVFEEMLSWKIIDNFTINQITEDSYNDSNKHIKNKISEIIPTFKMYQEYVNDKNGDALNKDFINCLFISKKNSSIFT